jgi:hypothetical protein
VRLYVPGKWPWEIKRPPVEVDAAYKLMVRQLLGDPTASVKDQAGSWMFPIRKTNVESELATRMQTLPSSVA